MRAEPALDPSFPSTYQCVSVDVRAPARRADSPLERASRWHSPCPWDAGQCRPTNEPTTRRFPMPQGGCDSGSIKSQSSALRPGSGSRCLPVESGGRAGEAGRERKSIRRDADSPRRLRDACHVRPRAEYAPFRTIRARRPATHDNARYVKSACVRPPRGRPPPAPCARGRSRSGSPPRPGPPRSPAAPRAARRRRSRRARP